MVVGEGEEGRFVCPGQQQYCVSGLYTTQGLHHSPKLITRASAKDKTEIIFTLCLHSCCHVIKCYHVIKEDLEGIYAL